MLRTLRATVRYLRHRTAQRRQVAASAPVDVIPVDVNLILHQSRSALMRNMPPGAGRLLSAGCSGSWYFDCVALAYGPVREHLGIEYYTPEPADLPANVTWIRNTCSDMSAVDDASCDLVFSGQNLEHLWPEEVAGFLLEAARVLPVGGHLAMDSPNRALTAPLVWSHPEHTIEFTPAEAARLMYLAGFDVTAMKGIYLCRDPRSGRMLPLDPGSEDPDFSLTERLVGAVDRPDDSMIWWAEAVRAARPPDAPALRALASDLFEQHWPERVQRLIVPAGLTLTTEADGTWIDVSAGHTAAVFFGPYMPLRAGRYRCTWRLRFIGEAEAPPRFDIMAGDHVLVEAVTTTDQAVVSLEIDLPELTFGLQFRCIGTGGSAFSVWRGIELERLPPA